jgi:hypothetical protein
MKFEEGREGDKNNSMKFNFRHFELLPIPMERISSKMFEFGAQENNLGWRQCFGRHGRSEQRRSEQLTSCQPGGRERM